MAKAGYYLSLPAEQKGSFSMADIKMIPVNYPASRMQGVTRA